MVEKERILIFADTHLFTEEDSLQKKKENLPIGERLFVKFFKSSEEKKTWMRWQCFREMVRKVGEIWTTEGSFSQLIDLGDATFGSYNQGLVSPETQDERRRYNETINTVFPGMKKNFVWGNHDVGFQNTISKMFNLGYWSRGISKRSFNAAEGLIGPAWNLFKIKGFNFLILNSEIVRAVNTIDSIDPSERLFFIEKEREQRAFIEKAFEIENVLEDEDSEFILLIHDPTQLKYLWPVLEQYTSRISLTLAGHFHFATSAWILKKYSRIYRELNLKVVPSPWPYGNEIVKKVIDKDGGGFVTLGISDSSFEINQHWLPKPDLD